MTSRFVKSRKLVTSQNLPQILSQDPETPKPAQGGLRKCLSALIFLGCGGKI
jgi:hypothetical protein